jgi:hypothetical protein
MDQVMLRYGARDDASLLLQYGFVMGGATAEANPHGPLPAALRAAEPAAEPAAAAKPEVAEPVAAAVAAGGGGGHAAACKRQRVTG